MLAAFVDRTGPPEVIQIGELPEPTLRDDDVLIAGNYATVNPIDCYLRSGAAPAKLPFPYVLGSDLAGVVQAVGSRVTDLEIGERVWTTLQGFAGRQGTTSERFVCSRRDVYRIPDGVDFQTAAAVGLVGMTAFVGLVEKAQLAAGETLFIRGGSGAVGLVAIQIGKILGATVISTAGTPEKADECRRAGADHVIDHRAESWSDAALRIAASGIDVVWDATRNADLIGACRVLRERGRIVLMAGREAESVLPIGPFYTKELQMFGLMIPKASTDAKERAAAALNRWMEREQLRLPIAAEFPLTQTADAHRLQESATIGNASNVLGKILIRLT